MNKTFDKTAAQGASVKDENKRITDKAMTTSMLACVFGLLVTAVLLVTTTWAWFTTDTGSQANVISSSYCTVEAVLDDSGNPLTPTLDGGDEVYNLSAGVEYTVKITVSGNATGGYCKLSFGEAPETNYFTEVIYSDSYVNRTADPSDINSISFKISVQTDKVLTVKCGWGIHSHENPELIDGGDYVFDEATKSFIDSTTP